MTSPGAAVPAPLALLAGGDHLPLEIAAAVRDAGRPVVVFALEGEADSRLDFGDSVVIRRGQLGRLISICRARGCRELVLAGAVRQRRLPTFSECDFAGVWHVLRNWRLLRGGDDSVLRRVARLLEAGGLTLVGVADVAPQMMAAEGVLGRVTPSLQDAADIAVGVAVARELGRRDVGQGVVVRHGTVLRREDVSGTDAMLRALAVAGSAGGVLVKCVKPQQDRRLDLPAIGPETVMRARDAGLAGIAVEAGGAIVVDRVRMIAEADAAGLFVVGIRVPEDGP